MSGFKEYDDHDALGLAELVRSGAVSPAELLEEAIARCESINPEINAVIHDMYDLARDAVATGLPTGAFTGVPFLLKDLGQAWAGVPMRIGSPGHFLPRPHRSVSQPGNRSGHVLPGQGRQARLPGGAR